MKSQNEILLLWFGITRMRHSSRQNLSIFLDEVGKARVFGYQMTYRLLLRSIEIKTYKTIILPAVLYGRESRSLRMGEKYRPRMFVSSV
jgi:hypothetical protein